MKSRRFITLGMVLLLFSIVVMCCLVFGWTRGISTNKYWGCKEAVNAYQFREVNGKPLRKIVKECEKDGINLNDNGNNFNYLKRNLREFSCPQSRKYLSVPKPLVALASFPGSGNTWTRELIETVTGLHTGSVYTDWNFVGSKMCPSRGKVFIIKTHKVNGRTNHPDCLKMGGTSLNYTGAIFILRNPYNALLAEFNRRNSPKPSDKSRFHAIESHAPVKMFGSEKWAMFVNQQATAWKHMALYWLEKFERPVHVLIYERLTESINLEMYNLTNFLNISMPFNSLYCISSNTTGNYHRVKPKWMTIEKLYNRTLRNSVNTVIENINAKVGFRRNITEVLYSYLLPVQ